MNDSVFYKSNSALSSLSFCITPLSASKSEKSVLSNQNAIDKFSWQKICRWWHFVETIQNTKSNRNFIIWTSKAVARVLTNKSQSSCKIEKSPPLYAINSLSFVKNSTSLLVAPKCHVEKTLSYPSKLILSFLKWNDLKKFNCLFRKKLPKRKWNYPDYVLLV